MLLMCRETARGDTMSPKLKGLLPVVSIHLQENPPSGNPISSRTGVLLTQSIRPSSGTHRETSGSLGSPSSTASPRHPAGKLLFPVALLQVLG